jgi:predicted alpha/beta-fold hydrolase
MQKHYFFTLLLWILVFTSRAQNSVSGRIMDAQRRMYLAGATILVEKTLKGTSSDANGNFTLDGVSPGAVLLISHLGYESQKVTVPEPGGTLSIALTDL